MENAEVKKLTIVAEMPEAAGKALAYEDGRLLWAESLELWAEIALSTAFRCDCEERSTPWAADVQRLFGFGAEDTEEAFNVTEVRIEDMDGPEKEPVPVELDAEEWAELGELASATGETRKQCLTRLLKEWLEERARARV